jgi:hypothetical protein
MSGTLRSPLSSLGNQSKKARLQSPKGRVSGKKSATRKSPRLARKSPAVAPSPAASVTDEDTADLADVRKMMFGADVDSSPEASGPKGVRNTASPGTLRRMFMEEAGTSDSEADSPAARPIAHKKSRHTASPGTFKAMMDAMSSDESDESDEETENVAPTTHAAAGAAAAASARSALAAAAAPAEAHVHESASPAHRKPVTEVRSIMSAPRARSVRPRGVQWGSPKVSEFNKRSPVTSLTPMPSQRSRLLYSMEGMLPVAGRQPTPFAARGFFDNENDESGDLDAGTMLHGGVGGGGSMMTAFDAVAEDDDDSGADASHASIASAAAPGVPDAMAAAMEAQAEASTERLVAMRRSPRLQKKAATSKRGASEATDAESAAAGDDDHKRTRANGTTPPLAQRSRRVSGNRYGGIALPGLASIVPKAKGKGKSKSKGKKTAGAADAEDDTSEVDASVATNANGFKHASGEGAKDRTVELPGLLDLLAEEDIDSESEYSMSGADTSGMTDAGRLDRSEASTPGGAASGASFRSSVRRSPRFMSAAFAEVAGADAGAEATEDHTVEIGALRDLLMAESPAAPSPSAAQPRRSPRFARSAQRATPDRTEELPELGDLLADGGASGDASNASAESSFASSRGYELADEEEKTMALGNLADLLAAEGEEEASASSADEAEEAADAVAATLPRRSPRLQYTIPPTSEDTEERTVELGSLADLLGGDNSMLDASAAADVSMVSVLLFTVTFHANLLTI